MPRLPVWDTVQDAYGFVLHGSEAFIGKISAISGRIIAAFILCRFFLILSQRYGGGAAGAADGAAAAAVAAGPAHAPHIVPIVLTGIAVLMGLWLVYSLTALCVREVRHVLDLPAPEKRWLKFFDRDVVRVLAADVLFLLHLAVAGGATFGFFYLLRMIAGGTHSTFASDIFLLGKILIVFGMLYGFLRGIWLVVPTSVVEGTVLPRRSWRLASGKFPEFLVILLMTMLVPFVIRLIAGALFGTMAANGVKAIRYAHPLISGIVSTPGLSLLAWFVACAVFVMFVQMLLIRTQITSYIACRELEAEKDRARFLSSGGARGQTA